MFRNLSSADSIIRLITAIVVFVLIFNGILSSTAAVILGILAGILLITAVVRFCPIYYLLKISTYKKISKA